MSSTNDKTAEGVKIEHEESSVSKPTEHEHAGSLDSVLQEERHLSVLETAKLH